MHRRKRSGNILRRRGPDAKSDAMIALQGYEVDVDLLLLDEDAHLAAIGVLEDGPAIFSHA
jgi:hypothetical protein